MEVRAEREPVGAVRSGPVPSTPAALRTRLRCPWARLGVAFYRGRYVHWQIQRGAELPTWRRPRNCADARYLANVWAERSFASRQAYEVLIARRREHLLDDSATAIMYVFGPVYGPQAIRVASCESGHSMTPRAQNGQYLGIFQMGFYARSKYGHGQDRLTQVRAAYHYFVDSGRDWSPWSCKP